MSHSIQYAIGIPIIFIGFLFIVGGYLKSDFIVYKLLAARPAGCMGEENKHSVMQIYGLMMCVFGVLIITGVIASDKH